jgi:hypothetical protein
MPNITHTPNSPRPTMAEAKKMLADRGWTPSAGSWEDERMVFAFSQESYAGTYGGAAAVVSWNQAGWLQTPALKPKNVRFV